MLDRYQAIDPRLLDLKPDSRLLDVGCGTGRHILELSRCEGTFVGLDMSEEDLKKMRYLLALAAQEGRLVANVHMAQGDGMSLPFEDNEFDHVICTETLEHVDDDEAMLRDLIRVLRPGGVLVVSVPDEYSERLLWRLSPRYRTAPGGHVRIYRRKRIIGLLTENGAEPYSVQYRHSLESVRWLVHSVIDKEWGEPGRITRGIRWLLDTPSHRNWRALAWADAAFSRVLPKSIVLYGRKMDFVAR
ncbi:MAG: class I SAM-dependent methyltransferase [Chloroflexi bacterium]|nr:class I SAM-dependent methyltransferase [Chloroflexota bacterium]